MNNYLIYIAVIEFIAFIAFFDFTLENEVFLTDLGKETIKELTHVLAQVKISNITHNNNEKS